MYASHYEEYPSFYNEFYYFIIKIKINVEHSKPLVQQKVILMMIKFH